MFEGRGLVFEGKHIKNYNEKFNGLTSTSSGLSSGGVKAISIIQAHRKT